MLSSCLVLSSPYLPPSLIVNGHNLCPPCLSLFPDCLHLLLPCPPSSLVYISWAVTPLFCHSWQISNPPVWSNVPRWFLLPWKCPCFCRATFFALSPCCISRLFGFSFPVQLLIVSSVDLCLSFYHVPCVPFLCCTRRSNKSHLKSCLPHRSAFRLWFCLPCGALTLTDKDFMDFWCLIFGLCSWHVPSGGLHPLLTPPPPSCDWIVSVPWEWVGWMDGLMDGLIFSSGLGSKFIYGSQRTNSYRQVVKNWINNFECCCLFISTWNKRNGRMWRQKKKDIWCWDQSWNKEFLLAVVTFEKLHKVKHEELRKEDGEDINVSTVTV